MSRKRLRKSEIKQLDLLQEVSKKDIVEQTEDALLINGSFDYFMHEDKWIPSVRFVLNHRDILPKVVVDMGAVRHIAQGADVMRPGITDIPDVKEESIVVVVDEKNSAPLVIGKMLHSGLEMQKLSTGKVIQNLHYVGDDLWKKYV